jgi:hypothetical protein
MVDGLRLTCEQCGQGFKVALPWQNDGGLEVIDEQGVRCFACGPFGRVGLTLDGFGEQGSLGFRVLRLESASPARPRERPAEPSQEHLSPATQP